MTASVIVGGARTPIGRLLGAFKDLSAADLGGVAIKGALEPLPGVQLVNVDIPTKKVRVEFDESKVDVDKMKAAVEEEEYPVAAVE